MSIDAQHTIVAVSGLGLLGVGAWRAWGDGYALLIIGGLLLAAVIYARSRHD